MDFLPKVQLTFLTIGEFIARVVAGVLSQLLPIVASLVKPFHLKSTGINSALIVLLGFDCLTRGFLPTMVNENVFLPSVCLAVNVCSLTVALPARARAPRCVAG